MNTPLEITARQCSEECANKWYSGDSVRLALAQRITPIILDALRQHCEHEWPVISSVHASTTDPLALVMGADYGPCIKCGKERESL
jgi:hypothetical protein